MTPKQLLASFDVLAGAPGGIAQLRQLVLDLAVRGKLVTQNNDDTTTVALLEESAAAYADKVSRGRVPKKRELENRNPALKLEFPLPKSWKWVILDDIASYIQRGRGPEYDDKGTTAVISQKCIQWSGFDASKARFISNKSLPDYGEERFLSKDDLLLNSTGTGTVGRVGLFPGARGKIVADSHVTIIRTDIVQPSFVFLWFASRHIQDSMDVLTTGTTNQKEFNLTTVRRLPVPIAPLAEQGRIVARVNELMALTDELAAALSERDDLHAAFAKAAVHHMTA